MIDRVRALLEGRWPPLVAGALTALVIWWVWGSLNQPGVYHDEVASLLQAKLFASGRWTGPGRPLPEFFEQVHVLVTPVLAAKYWPGHALLMVPGVWLGLPGLVPVLLGGLTGALCFALARRVANPWVAAAAWFFWTTAPGHAAFQASYFSEVTTGALWLLGWWALLDWCETGQRHALLALAACTGWGAVTRPLTAMAFAIPVGVVALRRVAARQGWRDLALAGAFGTAMLGVIPLWSARTTGDWRVTPYVAYSRLYTPFERLGFGFDSTPPLRALPPDMERLNAQFREIHREHTLAALPRTLAERLRRIGDDMWHGWRAVLLPLAILGLFALPVGAGFAVGTAALLVLVHLAYAHDPRWSIYYFELQPVLALLAALGVGVAAPRVAAWLGAGRHSRLAVVLLCSATLVLAVRDLRAVRRALARSQGYARGFAALVRRIPDPKAIVFLRYGPNHNVHTGLIVNQPDLDRARAWIVYDRGPENARLLALAPERTPYLYDEATQTLAPLKERPK